MPPLASANRPDWPSSPNSCKSSAGQGRAAQLMVCSGLSRRWLAWCSAWVITPLPAPEGPRISTGTSMVAMLLAWISNCSICGLRVWMRDCHSCCCFGRVRLRACSMVTSSSSLSMGLVRKLNTPERVAWMASGMVPWAVMMITGMPSHWDWIRSNSASPSMPPMRRSLSTRSARCWRSLSSAPSALSAVSTS